MSDFRRLVLRVDLLTFLAIFAGLMALDLNYLACDLTPDDIMYAQDTESGPFGNPGLFWRSSHILWSITTFLFLRLWQLFGYHGGAILPMQFLSVIYTALSAAIMFLILFKLTRNWIISTSVSLMFHFSAWVWLSALHPKIYPSAVMFQLLAIYFLFFPPPGKTSGPILAGLCQALSILYHFATVFFIPAPLVYFLFRHSSWRTKLLDGCTYLASAAIIPFGFILYVYTVLMRCHPGPGLSNFIDWLLMRRASTGAFVANRDLAAYFGFLNEQIISKFPPPAIKNDGWMLAMNHGPGITRAIYALLLLGLLVLLVAAAGLIAARFTGKLTHASTAFRSILSFWKHNMACFVFLAAGLLLMLLAFYVVDPHNGLAYILLVPFFLLLGLSLSPLAIPGRKGLLHVFLNGILYGVLMVLVLVLFKVNLAGGIYPASRIENNVELMRVLSLKKQLERDDIVVSLGVLPDARYFQYFLGLRVIEIQLFFQWYNKNTSLSGQSVDPYLKLGEIINGECKKHRVFLYSSLFRPEIPALLRQYPPFMGMRADYFSAFFKKNYTLRFYRQSDPDAVLYRLIPRGGNIRLPYAI